MTATYQKDDLKFLYPENWTLTDTPEEDHRAIHLESPGGFIVWSVHLHPQDTDVDFLLDQTVDALRVTYPDLVLSTDAVEFEEFPGKSFVALFFCLDFLVRTRLQVYQTPKHTMLLWYQCEERDFDQQKIVFQAISTSLMQSL